MAMITATTTPMENPMPQRSAETSSEPWSVPYAGESVTTRL